MRVIPPGITARATIAYVRENYEQRIRNRPWCGVTGSGHCPDRFWHRLEQLLQFKRLARVHRLADQQNDLAAHWRHCQQRSRLGGLILEREQQILKLPGRTRDAFASTTSQMRVSVVALSLPAGAPCALPTAVKPAI